MPEPIVRHEAGLNVLQKLRMRFAERYGGSPSTYRAPGRVNLIGEHTDYNDGLVMPAALDLYTHVAMRSRPDRKLRVYSENMAEGCDLDLELIRPGKSGHWIDYVRGVAGVLETSGCHLQGADVVIMSDVPVGAGLSSSAALEVALAMGLLANSQVEVDRTAIARMCQRAEHLYPETRCGIMDQFIACHGRARHALLVDCRSLEFKPLPLPEHVRLMICNTMVKHEHASGEYNERRRECEESVRALSGVLPHLAALRDLTFEDLHKHRHLLSPTVYRRARHVVTENARVEKAARALQAQDMASFGQLMAESHRSLRDDYEVSCQELDLMVELASQQEGVYGARMTGGGFGGCTINLVDAERAAEIRQETEDKYQSRTGLKPTIYLCQASEGAGQID